MDSEQINNTFLALETSDIKLKDVTRQLIALEKDTITTTDITRLSNEARDHLQSCQILINKLNTFSLEDESIKTDYQLPKTNFKSLEHLTETIFF